MELPSSRNSRSRSESAALTACRRSKVRRHAPRRFHRDAQPGLTVTSGVDGDRAFPDPFARLQHIPAVARDQFRYRRRQCAASQSLYDHQPDRDRKCEDAAVLANRQIGFENEKK
jgi:hypothetical protein